MLAVLVWLLLVAVVGTGNKLGVFKLRMKCAMVITVGSRGGQMAHGGISA